ncbi:MAG: mannose-1-phosphate guanyltransferase, partial [Sulfuricurvum sp.]|nr:mannose-1-phosphate guanyltransferase [Sulfuricurvum sp.]
AVDVMHGFSSEVFPDILNDLGVENIMFNAFPDQQSLANIHTLTKRTHEDMSAVIRALNLNAGFIIYPHGQRLDIVCNNGIVLSKQTALYVVLSLLDMEAKVLKRKKRVFLPTWAADIGYFFHLKIDRGQYSNFKSEEMKKYDLIATGEGNYAFTEFATHRDSMFATLNILELIVKHRVKLSAMIEALPIFYYHTFQLMCTQALKGKMMRMFLEDAHGKESSTLEGVKIWFDTHDWILMIPDQYNDYLNLYIQAETEETGEKIHQTYLAKIDEWMKL